LRIDNSPYSLSLPSYSSLKLYVIAYFFQWGEEMKVDYKFTHNISRFGNIDIAKFRAMIAERAYSKAEKRGFTACHEMDDWLEAEREVSNQYFYWLIEV
jgi:hypothetical protein